MPIRTELQVFQAAAQWRFERYLADHASNLLAGHGASGADNGFSPLLEMIVRVSRQRLHAFGRQRRGFIDEQPHPFHVGVRGPKDIGKKVSGLALVFREPIKEFSQMSGLIAGAHHGIEADAIGDLLLIFFAIEVAERRAFLGPDILKLVPFLKNIIAIAHLVRVQGFAEHARYVDRYLMCDHVADLMSQQAGEFIFILQEGDKLPRDINLAASQREGVVDGIVNNVELIVPAGWRELRKHALTHLL